MRYVTEPEIYLDGRQTLESDEARRFMSDHETFWTTDSENYSQLIVELAGKTCYHSFGDRQSRKTSSDYVGHLINQAHGSVLELAVWDLLIIGVSRNPTHEQVRRRAGIEVSQRSQRYVDESIADFVELPIIACAPEQRETWLRAIEATQAAYHHLARAQREHPDPGRAQRLKMARTVLPNATETKRLFSANARALRWIIVLRGDEGAEPEIRRLAVRLCRPMQREVSNLFGEFEMVRLSDGTEGVRTEHEKV